MFMQTAAVSISLAKWHSTGILGWPWVMPLLPCHTEQTCPRIEKPAAQVMPLLNLPCAMSLPTAMPGSWARAVVQSASAHTASSSVSAPPSQQVFISISSRTNTLLTCTQATYVHQEGRLRVTIRHAGTHSFRPSRTANSSLGSVLWLGPQCTVAPTASSTTDGKYSMSDP